VFQDTGFGLAMVAKRTLVQKIKLSEQRRMSSRNKQPVLRNNVIENNQRDGMRSLTALKRNWIYPVAISLIMGNTILTMAELTPSIETVIR